MKKALFFILLLVSVKVYSTGPDSTIFDTRFEYETFKSLSDSTSLNNVDLFLAVTGKDNTEAKIRIDEFVSNLRTEKFEKLKMKKKLKVIYNSVHNSFLKKYVELSQFSSIFRYGEFNCVSSTALFALVLDRCDIPYSIMISSTHAYMIADPDGEGFLIETTQAEGGLIAFDEKFQNDYVDYLYKNKLISEEEYMYNSSLNLFKKHFANDTRISISELAGIQYYNKGLVSLINDKNITAYNCFEKASILYPANNIKFLTIKVLSQLLSESTMKNKLSADQLVRFGELTGCDELNSSYISAFFESYSKYLLIDHSDIKAYKAFNKQLTDHHPDEKFMALINPIYFKYCGYYYYSIYDYPTSLLYLGRACSYNQDDLLMNQLITETVIRYIIGKPETLMNVDTLDHYMNVFTSLKQNMVFKSFYLNSYGVSVSNCLMNNDLKGCEQIIASFESYMAENPDVLTDEAAIDKIYGELSAYYVRKQQYRKALAILERGLKLFPASENLLHRADVIHSYLGEKTSGKTETKSIEIPTDYIVAMTRASANKYKINQGVSQFLKGKWKLSFTSDNEYLELEILPEGKVIMSYDHERISGKWKYSETSCTVSFVFDEEETLDLIIEEIGPKTIIGALYYDNVISDIEEVVLVKK